MASKGCTNFDGTANGYVNMGLFSGLDGSSEMSMLFWYNPNVIANDTSIGGKYELFPNSPFYHSIESNKWSISIVKNGGEYRVTSSTDDASTFLAVDNWYFSAYTWKKSADDISDFKLYINGNSKSIFLAGPVGTLTSIPASAIDYEIGCLKPGNFAINSRISYIALYNKQLSQSEVIEAQFNPYSIQNGLVSLIPLNSTTSQDMITGVVASSTGSGATASDLSPPIFLLCGQ